MPSEGTGGEVVEVLEDVEESGSFAHQGSYVAHQVVHVLQGFQSGDLCEYADVIGLLYLVEVGADLGRDDGIADTHPGEARPLAEGPERPLTFHIR